MLTSMELQLLQSLQQKQIAGERANQLIPASTPAPALDLAGLNGLIDQRVSERLQALQMPPAIPVQPMQVQRPQPMPQPATDPNMLALKTPQVQLLDRLRPLFMAALTLEQKGRLAELAFAVHAQSNSTEHAYRMGFDAFCDFLGTPTGREWIQVGTNAFFQALEPQAQVPQNISVQSK
jgi:hypothetical protein